MAEEENKEQEQWEKTKRRDVRMTNSSDKKFTNHTH